MRAPRRNGASRHLSNTTPPISGAAGAAIGGAVGGASLATGGLAPAAAGAGATVAGVMGSEIAKGVGGKLSERAFDSTLGQGADSLTTDVKSVASEYKDRTIERYVASGESEAGDADRSHDKYE